MREMWKQKLWHGWRKKLRSDEGISELFDIITVCYYYYSECAQCAYELTE